VKLLVTGPFATTVTVAGEVRRFAAAEGQTFDVDEETALALLRDVSGFVQQVCPAVEAIIDVEPFAETVAEEPVVEMVQVPAEIAVPARTRQIARKPAVKPGPKPTARKKAKP
jgi:hypothetical protein